MEERSITAQEIREIYAYAAKLGMRLHGEDDDLHILVHGVTGKDSIRAMTKSEFFAVLYELKRRQSGGRPAPATSAQHKKPKPNDFPPGKVTAAQSKYIFGAAYEIIQKEHLEQSAGELVRDYIKQLLGTDINLHAGNPFRMIDTEDGSKIIEGLKQRLKYADANYRRRMKRKSSG